MNFVFLVNLSQYTRKLGMLAIHLQQQSDRGARNLGRQQHSVSSIEHGRRADRVTTSLRWQFQLKYAHPWLWTRTNCAELPLCTCHDDFDTQSSATMELHASPRFV